MASTYESIASSTLGSAQSSVTFSSLGSFTDLIVVYSGTADNNLSLRFNSDSNSNYSVTRIGGYGSGTVSSSRYSNISSMYGAYSSSENATTWQVFNYRNTNVYKSALCRGGGADYATEFYAGLWRNTDAITSLTVLSSTGNMSSGSTISVYGIKVA